MEEDLAEAFRLEAAQGTRRSGPRMLYTYRQTSDTQIEIVVTTDGEVTQILPMTFSQCRLLLFQLARAIAQWPL